MNQKIIKICLRIIGTFAGVYGLLTLVFTPFLFFHAKQSGITLMSMFLLFPILIGTYAIYFCYLTWRKLSPSAIRHFFGVIGFFIIITVMKYMDMSPKKDLSWEPFAYIGLLIAIYYGYRWLSNRVTKSLFPEIKQ